MIRFIDTTTAVRYTSPLDTDENKTVFLITPLTSQELQVVNDATIITEVGGPTTGSMKMKMSLRNRLIVQLGLKGIENITEEYTVQFRSILGLPKKDVIDEALLNKFPIDIIVELSQKIQELSTLEGISLKN